MDASDVECFVTVSVPTARASHNAVSGSRSQADPKTAALISGIERAVSVNTLALDCKKIK